MWWFIHLPILRNNHWLTHVATVQQGFFFFEIVSRVYIDIDAIDAIQVIELILRVERVLPETALVIGRLHSIISFHFDISEALVVSKAIRMITVSNHSLVLTAVMEIRHVFVVTNVLILLVGVFVLQVVWTGHVIVTFLLVFCHHDVRPITRMRFRML